MEDMIKKLLEEITLKTEKKVQANELAKAAVGMYELFRVFVNAGFNEAQATELVKGLLCEAVRNAMK